MFNLVGRVLFGKASDHKKCGAFVSRAGKPLGSQDYFYSSGQTIDETGSQHIFCAPCFEGHEAGFFPWVPGELSWSRRTSTRDITGAGRGFSAGHGTVGDLHRPGGAGVPGSFLRGRGVTSTNQLDPNLIPNHRSILWGEQNKWLVFNFKKAGRTTNPWI